MDIEDIMDAEAWLNGAPTGSEITYYRGNLPRARVPSSRRGRTVNAIADMMLGHSGCQMRTGRRAAQGPRKVVLYQIRHGEFDYSYRAQKVAR